MVWQFFTTLVIPASNITSSGGHSKSIALFSIYTVNDRLNALSVYLKIQNFKGAIIREGRLIKRGVVYFKMHKVRKQKRTFSGGHSHSTYALKCRKLDPPFPLVRMHTFLPTPSLTYVLFGCNPPPPPPLLHIYFCIILNLTDSREGNFHKF